jgi:hypothetical protein
MAIDKNQPGISDDENAASDFEGAKATGKASGRASGPSGRAAALPGNTHDT